MVHGETLTLGGLAFQYSKQVSLVIFHGAGFLALVPQWYI